MQSTRVRSDSVFVGVVDPFAPAIRFWPSVLNVVLATAIFRCWHILLFFALWSTAVCLISHFVISLSIQPTLLTVAGTVLGFVISYRTTSSFERYNEGRKLWSQIILNCRTFSRLVWFHTPDAVPDDESHSQSDDQRKARVLIEKKTVINLLEAFAVAVKHYLRAEEGIFYEDLYHLVKFLPAYALPNGIGPGSSANFSDMECVPSRDSSRHRKQSQPSIDKSREMPGSGICIDGLQSNSAPHLPFPASTPRKHPDFLAPVSEVAAVEERLSGKTDITTIEKQLLPSRLPPKHALFDFFPSSSLVRSLAKRGVDIQGKKAAKVKAKLKGTVVSHNIPLEISLYLSSYISALMRRGGTDAITHSALLSTLAGLVDALTGLERILTTPIPFSYSFHLWLVTTIYCLFLPFQIWSTLKWFTIPGTTIVSLIFFGFIVAGEEIENPFGYDKNDLNMDHFTHIIIRHELHALTATHAPEPSEWAFSSMNDHMFSPADQEQCDASEPVEKVTPAQWMDRGLTQIQDALSAESAIHPLKHKLHRGLNGS